MDRMTALTVFREVARLNSFAAAARRLELSAPAVSKNVAELEAQLGVRLVNRTTRRMSLTDEGRRYLEHVERALDELADGAEAVGPGRGEPGGHLKISVPMSIGLLVLSPALPRFLARHPGISLDVDLDDRRVDLVGDGFDLAIRGLPAIGDSSLVARPLASIPYVFCGAPAYFERAGRPRTPAELASHAHIRFGVAPASPGWTFRQGDRVERVPIVARYTVGSSLLIRDALVGGFGVSLIPRLYVAADLAAGRLESVLDDWSVRPLPLYVVYPSRQHQPARLRLLIDFLIGLFVEAGCGATGGEP